MNCLQDNTIQAYIDKELDNEKVIIVEAHILKCDECKQRVQNRVGFIHQLNNTLMVGSLEIPEFTYEKEQDYKPIKKKRLLHWSLEIAASVVFIISIVLMNNHKNSNEQYADIQMYYMEMEIDANKPFHQQEFEIMYFKTTKQ